MRNSIAAPWCSTSFLCVPNRGLFQSPQSACTDSPSSRLPALRCFFNVKICSVVFPFGLKLACSFLSFFSIPFLIRSSSTLWNILLMMGSNFHTQFSPPPFPAIFLVMLFGYFLGYAVWLLVPTLFSSAFSVIFYNSTSCHLLPTSAVRVAPAKVLTFKKPMVICFLGAIMGPIGL